MSVITTSWLKRGICMKPSDPTSRRKAIREILAKSELLAGSLSAVSILECLGHLGERPGSVGVKTLCFGKHCRKKLRGHYERNRRKHFINLFRQDQRARRKGSYLPVVRNRQR